MSNTISKDLLELFESLLRAQLNTIRQLRKGPDREKRATPKQSMSQIDIVYDILAAAQHPMHVDAILEQAQKQFKRHLDKESIVSALTKRVKRQDRFIKTAANTFALIAREVEGGRR
jgi:hypothetical protein